MQNFVLRDGDTRKISVIKVRVKMGFFDGIVSPHCLKCTSQSKLWSKLTKLNISDIHEFWPANPWEETEEHLWQKQLGLTLTLSPWKFSVEQDDWLVEPLIEILAQVQGHKCQKGELQSFNSWRQQLTSVWDGEWWCVSWDDVSTSIEGIRMMKLSGFPQVWVEKTQNDPDGLTQWWMTQTGVKQKLS